MRKQWDYLAVLVKLEFGDNAVGGVDADLDSGSVDLLPLSALDVDHELLTVDVDDASSGLAFVVTSDNHDLIIRF